jgi:ubiquitin-protein ligase
MQNRLLKEAKMLATQTIPGTSVTHDRDNLHKWIGTVQGPAGSFYEGGIFRVEIVLPENYPFGEPIIKMVTRIYHPGVDEKGDVCLKALLGGKDWASTLGIADTIKGFSGLLANPGSFGAPLRGDLAVELQDNPAEFARKARDMVRQYAH